MNNFSCVLAVMDDQIGVIHPNRSPEEAAWLERVVEARAAVAELIDAIDAERAVHFDKDVHLMYAKHRTNAALARVKGE